MVPGISCSAATKAWLHLLMLFLLPAVVLVLWVAVVPKQAVAAEDTVLLMVTSDHCPWCEAFEEEVGVLYDKTPESAIYPLRRIDFYGQMPEQFSAITRATMTPTFIFVRDNKEIGRIAGYPGSELFWWRMSEFLPDEG